MECIIEVISSGVDGEKKKEFPIFVTDSVICDLFTGGIDSANFSPIPAK